MKSPTPREIQRELEHRERFLQSTRETRVRTAQLLLKLCK
jgi:hypothetical protein